MFHWNALLLPYAASSPFISGLVATATTGKALKTIDKKLQHRTGDSQEKSEAKQYVQDNM
jgi:hypothetical protein